MTRRRTLAVTILACGAWTLLASRSLDATAFSAVGKHEVFAANNENWNNPRTRVWFVPATPGTFGRIYLGYDDLRPQGGMNERGLWFDGFLLPAVKVTSTLPRFSGNLIDKAMAECATVEEVVRLFTQYDRSFLSESALVFADASGDAVSIEGNAIVRKTGRYFVQSNFHLSRPETGADDYRFKTANEMLDAAGGDVSVDLFRRILDVTRESGDYPTLFSNISELRSRTLHLYHFGDLERVVSFRLDEELKKGARVLEIASLFPRKIDAEAFASRPPPQQARNPLPIPMEAVVAVIAIAVVGVAVFAGIKGGRRVRFSLVGIAAALVLVAAATGGLLRKYSDASNAWVTFSIGPASGRSTSISTYALRSDGVALTTALSVAYDIPATRIFGPPWLPETRYAITAIAPADSAEGLRPLLQRELVNRLRLKTHFEVRPFDVYVLSAPGPLRVTPVPGKDVRIWVRDTGMSVHEATFAGVASALQGVVGKPVIDETALTGSYNLEIEWTADKVPSLIAALEDKIGLRLTMAKRDLEVLVVDEVHPDASLVVLEHIGRAAKNAPPSVREHLARLLRVY